MDGGPDDTLLFRWNLCGAPKCQFYHIGAPLHFIYGGVMFDSYRQRFNAWGERTGVASSLEAILQRLADWCEKVSAAAMVGYAVTIFSDSSKVFTIPAEVRSVFLYVIWLALFMSLFISALDGHARHRALSVSARGSEAFKQKGGRGRKIRPRTRPSAHIVPRSFRAI